jgi:hypothetical protein
LLKVMHGMNGRYTGYFNRKYSRTGHLFHIFVSCQGSREPDRNRVSNLPSDPHFFQIILRLLKA